MLKHMIGMGCSPLIAAIRKACPATHIRCLLDSGADVTKFDKNGDSALLIAASRIRSVDIVKMLIVAGGDPN